MITGFYAFVFGLSLTLVAILLIRNKRVDSLLMVSAILICCNCFGRYVQASAETLETALLANRFIYLGACYIPLLMTFFLAGLCGLRISKTLRLLLICLSSAVFLLSNTVGYNDWYYRSVQLVRVSNYSYLVKEYGPAHKLFVVLLILYGALMAFYIGYSLVNRNRIALLTTVTISSLGFVVFFMYAMEQISDSQLSFLTVGYLVGIMFLTRYYERLKIYDMSSNIVSSVENRNNYAYLMLDDKYRYVNANPLMKQLYPEIENWKVDKTVPVSDTRLYQRVIGMIVKQQEEKIRGQYINREDQFYLIDIRKIPCGRKNRFGYLIELADRTMEKKYYNAIEEYNVKLRAAVEEQTLEIREQQKKTKRLFLQTVAALSEAVDASDRYTSGHSRRVAEYSRMIAERMGMSKEEQEEVFQAGLLHDIGKIRIPAEIINKPGKLTDEEFAIIKIHPVTGYHILHEISEDRMIAISAKYHHERYDGTGYPNGLTGEKIPEVARILGVADSYDAMTSNRSYRDALPQAVVREEIERGKGTQFDPRIADIMLELIDQDTEYRLRQVTGMKKRILSVDDEPMNNKIIARIMKDEPMYEVVPVNSGEQALELLQEQEFELILLDMLMPGMDGLETLKQIRKTSQIPVVIMTADKMLDASVEFAKFGCDDYLTKPLQPLLLKEVVHNMIENEKTLYSELNGINV